MSNIKQIKGVVNKIPFNVKTRNFMVGSFTWAFGFINKENILTMESGALRCKDHLVDCLKSTTLSSLQYNAETSIDAPLILLLLLKQDNVLEQLQSGIDRMLHPLEKSNKWKQTNVEVVDTYLHVDEYGTKQTFTLYKVTASKMWKRNGFLFSIWASLLRIGFYYTTVTPTDFIETIQIKQTVYCNEATYIKNNAINNNYNKAWQFILNNLTKFKIKANKTTLNKDIIFQGHGTEGPFYILSHVNTNTDAKKRFEKSHPFATMIYDQLRPSTRTVS